jgi:hypothetical protein
LRNRILNLVIGGVIVNKYQLEVMFDKEDLAVIKEAKQKIIIAKPVGDEAAKVAWQTIDPFETNTISWTEEYGVYASDTNVRNGARINKVSTVDQASAGSYYTFKDNTFNPPDKQEPNLGTDQYGIHNLLSYDNYKYCTFGLMQQAIVNGKKSMRALNASMVLSHQRATFTPFTNVYVWLDGRTESETIITDVFSEQNKFKFGAGKDKIGIKYNPKLATFEAESK